MSEWEQIHAQINAIVRAIPEHFLLDPPDGGDVTVAEGVQRMAARIEKLESDLSDALTDLNTARQDNASLTVHIHNQAARIAQLEAEIKTAIRQFEDGNRLECHRTLCTVIYGKQH